MIEKLKSQLSKLLLQKAGPVIASSILAAFLAGFEKATAFLASYSPELADSFAKIDVTSAADFVGNAVVFAIGIISARWASGATQVAEVQKAEGLNPDGYVGPKTAAMFSKGAK